MFRPYGVVRTCAVRVCARVSFCRFVRGDGDGGVRRTHENTPSPSSVSGGGPMIEGERQNILLLYRAYDEQAAAVARPPPPPFGVVAAAVFFFYSSTATRSSGVPRGSPPRRSDVFFFSTHGYYCCTHRPYIPEDGSLLRWVRWVETRRIPIYLYNRCGGTVVGWPASSKGGWFRPRSKYHTILFGTQSDNI